MAHVIDTLFVELGLDTAKWTAGQKAAIASFKATQQEARKQAAAVSKSGDVAADFYKKLRNGVLTFFAALTAGRGIRDFIRDLSQGDANLGRLAASLGIATEDLAAWAKAVELAGGSASAATGTIASLSSKLQAFNLGHGDSDFLSKLGQFGIDAQNANGTFKETGQLLMDISRKAAQMPAAQATSWMQSLGIDPDTAILLRKGPQEVQKMLSQGRRLGLATETDSKQMQQFNQDILKLQTQILDLARTIFRDLEPSIHTFLNTLSQWLEKNRPWIEGEVAGKLREVAAWFKDIDWVKVGQSADHALDTIKQIVDAMGGWQTATEALIGLWLGAKAIKMLSMLALVFGGAGRLAGLGSLLGLAAGAAVVTNMVTQGGDAMSGNQHGSDVSPTQYGSFVGHSMFAKPFEGDVKGRVKQAMDFFMSKGHPRDEAAVIVGNLVSENATLDPNQWEKSGGGGYGLAQWTPEERKRSAGALVGRQTIVGASFNEQLEAIEGELTRGTHKKVGEALRKADTFLGKSAVVTRDYLSPANAEAQIAPRAAVGVRVLRTVPETPDAAAAPVANPATVRPGQGVGTPAVVRPGQGVGTPAVVRPGQGVGTPAVVRPGQGVGMLSPSGRSRMMPPMSEGGQHISMTIGDVTVHTAATDAKGVAKDMKVALALEFAKRGAPMRLSTQSNSGLV